MRVGGSADAKVILRIVDRLSVLRFRGSNHIDASVNLVLRSALLRASRRTATSKTELAAILRDGASRLLQDEVCGFKLHPPDPSVPWNHRLEAIK